jgi:hypothetical protein
MTMETILLICLFFGPPILAARGIGYRGAWFGVAALSLIAALLSCVGSFGMAMNVKDPTDQLALNSAVSVSLWLGITFIGCLLAGCFYREVPKD